MSMRKLACRLASTPKLSPHSTFPLFIDYENVLTTWCRSTNYTQTFSHSQSVNRMWMSYTRARRIDTTVDFRSMPLTNIEHLNKFNKIPNMNIWIETWMPITSNWNPIDWWKWHIDAYRRCDFWMRIEICEGWGGCYICVMCLTMTRNASTDNIQGSYSRDL